MPYGLLDADASGPGGPGTAARAPQRLTEPGDGGEDSSYAVVEASVDLVEEMARHDPVLSRSRTCTGPTTCHSPCWRRSCDALPCLGSASSGRCGRRLARPPSTACVELVRDGPGRHVRLGSLDEVDVHALASALTGAAPGEGLRERLRTQRPATRCSSPSCSAPSTTTACCGSRPASSTSPPVCTPANLHETLVRRLSWLPPETNELLRLASLLGSAFTLHDLAAITGRAVIDVAAWLREASLAGLIVGDGDRLAFRHDLIREAVYGHMLPAERRDLHRAAGQALAHAGAPTQQIAEQFARGALPGDLEAVTLAGTGRPRDDVRLPEQRRRLARARPWRSLRRSWPGRSGAAGADDRPARLVRPLRRRRGDRQQPSSPGARRRVEYTALRGLSAVYGSRGDTAPQIAALHRAAAAAGAPDDEARRLRCIAAQLSLFIGATGVEAARQLAEETLAQGIADRRRDDAVPRPSNARGDRRPSPGTASSAGNT